MRQPDFKLLQISADVCYLLLVDAAISEYYCLKAVSSDASW